MSITHIVKIKLSLHKYLRVYTHTHTHIKYIFTTSDKLKYTKCIIYDRN